MLAWFVDMLQRLVALALELAGRLVAGIVRAPAIAAARAVAPITIRRGTAAEVVDVRHQVLRAGLPRARAIFGGDEDPYAAHWVAVQADRVVGVVSVLPAPMPEPPAEADPVPQRQLRGMAVVPELRGQQLGAELLEACHGLGLPLWCNARAGVVDFYARYGWRSVGDEFLVPGVGPHRRMWWAPAATDLRRLRGAPDAGSPAAA